MPGLRGILRGGGGDTVMSRLLDSSGADFAFDTSAAETSVYSFAVPAGQLTTTRILRLCLIGDVLNNTGGGATLSLRFKAGGTTQFSYTSASLTTSANRRGVYGFVEIVPSGALNAQRSGGWATVSATGTDAGAVTGSSGIQHGGATGPFAVDLSGAFTVEITAQLSAALATLGFRKRAAYTELLTTN